MKPFSRNDSFFSSLDRVEKRLKSDTKDISSGGGGASEQLTGSPLYIGIPQPLTPASLPLEDSSEPAEEFISSSSPPSHHDASLRPDAADDDIDRLMDLLNLSTERKATAGDNSCDCSGGGFYSKIVGVKGPRCGRERRRLDGWIDYYYCNKDGEERREPARLAYLLLAKAAAGEDEHGLEEIGFPSALEDFLEHDPPASSSPDGC